MPFRREMMTVYVRTVDPETGDAGMTEHTVEVTHQDQIRAEVEAVAKRGLTMSLRDAPLTWNTLFAWCALTRLGLYKQEWRQFQNVDCLGWDDASSDDVPPTPQGPPTDGPSSSPNTSDTSTG